MSGYALRADKQGWRCVTGPDDLIDGETFSDTEPELTPVVPVPLSVTMMQARLAMLNAGILDRVEDAIAAMEGDGGKAAQIQWQYAMDVRRDWPLVVSLQVSLNLTDKQLDDLFIAAGDIQ